jgi:adenine-specific DNA-methyltransferase
MPDSFIRRHKGVIVENHLNMVRAVVPAPPVPPRVIAVLLNSGIVDAAFRCINGSVAVSAFELEELPLPSPPVIAAVDSLIAAGATAQQIEAVLLAAYTSDDAATAA